MGLPEQVVLILAIVIISQITHNQSVPLSPKKQSTQRYLDNLKQFKGFPSSSLSTSEINQLKQSIRKVSNGKLKNPFDYKSKNFLQKEYRFDNKQQDLGPKVKYEDYFQNNDWNLNKFKRDIKVQRKLQNFENEQKSQPQQKAFYTETQNSFNPYAVWSSDMEGFPETRYPLSITETWEPNYWDTFTNTQKKPDNFEFLPFGDLEQSKKYDEMKKASKMKINPFLKRYDSLKNKKIISVNMTNALKDDKCSNVTEKIDESINTNNTFSDSEAMVNNSLNITGPTSDNITTSVEPINNEENKINILNDIPVLSKSDSVNSALLQLIKALIENNQESEAQKKEQSEDEVKTNQATETPLNMQIPLPLEQPQKPEQPFTQEVLPITDNLKPTETTKEPAKETTIIVFVPPNYYNDALSETLRAGHILPPQNTIEKPLYGDEENSDINPPISKSTFTPNKPEKPAFEKMPANSMCQISTNKKCISESEIVSERKKEYINHEPNIPKTEEPTNLSVNLLPIETKTISSEDNSDYIPNTEIISNEQLTVTELIDIIEEQKTPIPDEAISHAPIDETLLVIETNPFLEDIQSLPEDPRKDQSLPEDPSEDQSLPEDLCEELTLLAEPIISEDEKTEEREEDDTQDFLEITQPMQVLSNFGSKDYKSVESNKSSKSESEEDPNFLQTLINKQQIYNLQDESTDKTVPVDSNLDV